MSGCQNGIDFGGKWAWSGSFTGIHAKTDKQGYLP